MSLRTASLGFPRIGEKRELKKALESYWKSEISKDSLYKIGKEIRKRNWMLQKENGVFFIPSNDFSFYDHVLDMIQITGAIPKRFENIEDELDQYFAMARGIQDETNNTHALEMTKWFDTNYHYLVPEFSSNQSFELLFNKVLNHYLEAKELGIETRPVIIGPISFLMLGKIKTSEQILRFLPKLLPVYKEILTSLYSNGAKNIQIDEPYLVTDLSDKILAIYKDTYNQISTYSKIKTSITTYFDRLGKNLDILLSLNVNSIHIDLVRGDQKELNKIYKKISGDKSLSLGLVDGRNIWINDLENSIKIVTEAVNQLGSERVIVSSSCSLIHSPVDLDQEKSLNTEIKNWLSFAKQKLKEINLIARATLKDRSSYKFIEQNKIINQSRKESSIIHNTKVKKRVSNISESDFSRSSSYDNRRIKQENHIKLPLIPTTTIGSFPQTSEVRKIRASFKRGDIGELEYNDFIKKEINNAIKFQEEINLDVLVHGEFERNDMVEYFGEQLDGFVFTKNGWVQSYGSRCVKPPIIYGDVSRNTPMTVKWTSYAQSITNKIVKGMLTGPVTILQWSFVRDDQPIRDTAFQIALAIKDEVEDLEKSGIKVVQIDEAALREGLPIKKENWEEYLDWAVKAFKLTSSGVEDKTQIHTHMCYSDFNDIIEDIAKMDADVISIETSRSNLELLDVFVNFKYPNSIGPGVYDIHSPRIPSKEDIISLIKKALNVIDKKNIWINPDCGLKTRKWEETRKALEHMVSAALYIRETELRSS